MQPTPTELQRLIDNLIRIGTVTAVRSGECRVKTGDLITNWRPYAAARAGKNRTRHRLSTGEQVLLLSVSGDLRNAYIVGPIHCDAFPEPLAGDDNPDLDRTEYSDGDVIEYNPATGALNASGIKSATLKIEGDKARVSGVTTLDRTAFGVGQGEWTSTDQIPAEVKASLQRTARPR